MRWGMIVGWLIVSVSLTACGGDSGGGTDVVIDDGGTEKAVGVENPTYHEHVATIFNDNCVTCHRTGGIAPFSLSDITAVTNFNSGAHISLVTKDRSMPPYLVDNSGQCNTFDNARWLSDNDIATIGNWVDTGMPVGDAPSTPLEPPVLSALTEAEISASAVMGADYSPAGSTSHPEDDYRCFVVDPGITKT